MRAGIHVAERQAVHACILMLLSCHACIHVVRYPCAQVHEARSGSRRARAHGACTASQFACVRVIAYRIVAPPVATLGRMHGMAFLSLIGNVPMPNAADIFVHHPFQLLIFALLQHCMIYPCAPPHIRHLLHLSDVPCTTVCTHV